MKRRIRRIRRALKRAGLYNVFHITLIAVLLTGFCVILFNVKEPEQQEKEPEEIQAEVMQNPETMTQTAENIEDKYKVFDTMSEDWGSDDLEGFVFYDLPEQYADNGSKCGLSYWNVNNPATNVNTNIVASQSYQIMEHLTKSTPFSYTAGC